MNQMPSRRGVKPLCGICRVPMHKTLSGVWECRRAACGVPAKPITKRTPIVRGTKPVKAKRAKPRKVSVVRDQSYMDWLKTQRCVICAYSVGGIQFTAQITPSEPAHTGKTNGMRSKSADTTCIPLCSRHHSEMDGRLSTAITTKTAFAEKYQLDLGKEANTYYVAYLIVTGKLPSGLM